MKAKILKHKYALLLFLTWGLYFIFLFARMMSIRPDGLYVGHENVWSDWASLHLGIASIFAYKEPQYWFAYHTVFADGKLTYAFLTNLISALFIRAGTSVPFSFLFPSIVFALALIYAMRSFYKILLGNELKAFFAICVFFFSAGLGFIDYWREFAKDPRLDHFFLITHQYSGLPSYDWFAGNFIIGMLLPQRAFLLGMLIALISLTGLFHALTHRLTPTKDKRTLVLSGLCAGLLPIAHMHSLIAMAFLLLPVILISYRDWRRLLYFAIPASALSITLYVIFIYGGIQNKNFMTIAPGLSAKGFIDWLSFWGRAWGVAIPLAVAGVLLLRKQAPKPIQAFFWGCFLLFAVTNIIQFQPTRWDNSKLFLWCYFGFSALAVHALSKIWNHRRALRPVAILLAAVLVFTGLLETIDLQRVNRHTYRLLSSEEMKLAEEIRATTDPLARFATAFTHDHPIAVWGARPILLGYTSWVHNYGMNYTEVEKDVREIYRGGVNTLNLLSKNRVSYVYFGPAELREFRPNEDYFKNHFPVAFKTSTGNIRVYDVRPR